VKGQWVRGVEIVRIVEPVVNKLKAEREEERLWARGYRRWAIGNRQEVRDVGIVNLVCLVHLVHLVYFVEVVEVVETVEVVEIV
jgi:hypothetical protein